MRMAHSCTAIRAACARFEERPHPELPVGLVALQYQADASVDEKAAITRKVLRKNIFFMDSLAAAGRNLNVSA